MIQNISIPISCLLALKKAKIEKETFVVFVVTVGQLLFYSSSYAS